jgi:hypothetical protein
MRKLLAGPSLLGLLLVAVASGFGAAADPVKPGGKIGTMTLVRGVAYESDLELFNVGSCNANFTKPGRYHRACEIPRVRKVYIGAAFYAQTKKALDRLWNHTTWTATLDGHPVSLAAFGTTDSPRRNGAFVRAWNVILVDPTTGKHTLHYRARTPSKGTLDMTWTFTVPAA